MITLPTSIDHKVLLQLEQHLPLLKIKRLVQSAAEDMASKLRFSEKEHTYERLSDGKYLVGTTSVSGLVPKNWLSAWGAKEAVKFLGYSDFAGDTAVAEEMLENIKAIESVSAYQKLLKEAKGAPFRKKTKALVDGKAGHAWLEEYVKAKMDGTKPPAIPKDELLARALKQFIAWEKKHVAFWLLSEAVVCDTENEYAGMLDAAAVMSDGALALVDFKFSSHIDAEYYLQTAGYAATFEQYKILFDKRIIVRLPKTLEKPEWNKKERKYEMVENTIEVHDVPTPYDLDKTTFLAALPVSKWINYLKRREQ